ncbi:MAG: GNAT family N-acetyltransferase, partial [Sphingomonas sp.]|nr:GNAT family N-acetyltransferase [Sphingomonas sp.]
MATVENDIQIERGSFADIDPVMRVMESAFGKRFGEAWTRSQLAGILPMAGVTLMLAREGADDLIVGFSLFRAVADESELLLLGVLADYQRQGIGRELLRHFLERTRNDGVTRL